MGNTRITSLNIAIGEMYRYYDIGCVSLAAWWREQIELYFKECGSTIFARFHEVGLEADISNSDVELTIDIYIELSESRAEGIGPLKCVIKLRDVNNWRESTKVDIKFDGDNDGLLGNRKLKIESNSELLSVIDEDLVGKWLEHIGFEHEKPKFFEYDYDEM